MVIAGCGTQACAEPIRQECLFYVDAAEGLAYDNDLHKRWYFRFWTGECEGFSAFQCLSGDPNWNQIVSALINENPQFDPDEILAGACPLGELVGYEWAKENHIRCIHTGDVEEWGGALENSTDPLDTIEDIREIASSRLGC